MHRAGDRPDFHVGPVPANGASQPWGLPSWNERTETVVPRDKLNGSCSQAAKSRTYGDDGSSRRIQES
ncbi:hypothetical protein GCM10009754_32820 [Amycolatopsis minnesotensis]|uniref:Uncharacterized protein n=1 Tax=Amycolatopsis minnesotensis TaxID=337894 RepID=A0ABN2QX76_9PSEU